MIGLVIATHSNLASELIAASGMIIGPLTNTRAVCVFRGDSVEGVRDKIERAIDEVDPDGNGVLIMTDMLGGTPSNVSLSFLESRPVEVLAGVNLPMVLKFFNRPGELSLRELASMLKSYGQQSITLASDLLKK